MPILNADGEPIATSTAPPTEVFLSVLESMEQNIRQETYNLISNTFGYDNPGYGAGGGYGRINDDIAGTQWAPVGVGAEDLTVGFQDESQLANARNIGRHLSTHNEFAINGHENRISYVVGTGHTYTVTKKKDEDTPEAWLKAAQARVDDFVKRNDWACRQAENLRRNDRDGEVFLRKFDKDGRLVIRVVEPSMVTTPTELVGMPQYTFGIQTDVDDVEEVIAYFVDGETVGAEMIQHRKGCVDSNVKRGRPLFYVVRDRLAHAQKLLVNMARTSDTQTAIAMIRRHQAMTGSQADAYKKDFLEKLSATGNLPTQSPNLTDNVALYEPGSIIDSSQKTEYEFPNQGLDASKYVMVLQALLRSIGAMVQQPEFMFTSDASNANLASTLVSEGPAVKRFQRDQSMVERADLELIWEDVEMGVGTDYPAEIMDTVEIAVGKPDVNVRDRREEAEVNQIYLNLRVKSPQTIAGELGLDFEQEQENLADLEPEELPPIVTNDPEEDDDQPSEPRDTPTEQWLEHTPGGHGHDQNRHGRKGSGRGRQTESGKFKRWFGDSKVVDANGNPLVVYHGTVESFTSFDRKLGGRNTQAKSGELGFFFTDDAETAGDYTEVGDGRKAKELQVRYEKLERIAKRTNKRADWKRYEDAYVAYEDHVLNIDYTKGTDGANVLPVYLKMENPLVRDFKGAEYREESFASLMRKAKRTGKDGVIFRNTIDPGNPNNKKPINVYAVLHFWQIKSATGNNGEFDPDNPDINEQAHIDRWDQLEAELE